MACHSEYIYMNQQIYDSIETKRYPEARFKFEFDNEDELYANIMKSITLWYETKNRLRSDYDFKPITLTQSDIYLAGGMYSEYCESSPFAHHYPRLFNHFKDKQDIDIWIRRSTDYNDYEYDCRSLHSSQYRIKNYNFIQIPFILPVDYFDFECAKIWSSASNFKQIMIPQSLLNHEKLNIEPSFENNYNENLIKCDHFRQKCVCTRIIRKLKYCFKNCFDLNNARQELIISDQLLGQKVCSLCGKSYFR